jgi:integrase
MQGRTWVPPKYKSPKKLPFIPTENEINQLIAGTNRKTTTFLQLLKETGMRSGEAWLLKLTDLNFKSNTVTITPEKGGEPRRLKMSTKLATCLTLCQRLNPKLSKGR